MPDHDARCACTYMANAVAQARVTEPTCPIHGAEAAAIEAPDPRAELRLLIAKALHDKGCGCGDYDPAGPGSLPYLAQADAVMALFPRVRQHWQDACGGWTTRLLPFPRATRFMLVTNTLPVGEAKDA